MDIFEGAILGLVQGLTEFIPVSSSGHLILVHHLLGYAGANDLSVDAVLQLATSLAVLVFFRREIFGLIVTFFRIMFRREVADSQKKLLFAVIVGTIPAVFLGLLLETKMETIFRSTTLVAGALVAGGVMMYLAEKFKTGTKTVGPGNGFVVGLFQSLALIPGISRSGATISGGLFSGLGREEATRFSFILSFPIIFGSGIKKLLDLWQTGFLVNFGFPMLVSFIVSFIVGLFAIKFLIRFLKNHSLNIFVLYRIILAILIIVLI